MAGSGGILLKVTPADVNNESKKVEKVRVDIKGVVDKIYQVKNALVGCKYKSDSANTYGMRMDEYRKHFTAMEALLGEYAAFLTRTALRYDTNENNLVGGANRLPV